MKAVTQSPDLFYSYILLDKRETDKITDYPTKLITPVKGMSVIEGDSHACPIKEMWFFRKFGILALKNGKVDYEQLITLYEKPVYEITTEDILAFDKILTQATFSPPENFDWTWIGDRLADRGKGDHWMLLWSRHVRKAMPTNKTLLSNHDLAFIINYLNGAFKKNAVPLEYAGHDLSQINFQKLIQNGVIAEELAETLIQDYLKQLVLIKYKISTASDGKPILAFMTHAPQLPAIILEVGQTLGLTPPEKFSSISELTDFIDKINAKFLDTMKDPAAFKMLLETKVIDKLAWQRFDYAKADYKLFAEKKFSEEASKSLSNSFAISDTFHIANICGHDSFECRDIKEKIPLDGLTTLDNANGKFGLGKLGNYGEAILVSVPSSEIENIKTQKELQPYQVDTFAKNSPYAPNVDMTRRYTSQASSSTTTSTSESPYRHSMYNTLTLASQKMAEGPYKKAIMELREKAALLSQENQAVHIASYQALLLYLQDNLEILNKQSSFLLTIPEMLANTIGQHGSLKTQLTNAIVILQNTESILLKEETKPIKTTSGNDITLSLSYPQKIQKLFTASHLENNYKQLLIECQAEQEASGLLVAFTHYQIHCNALLKKLCPKQSENNSLFFRTRQQDIEKTREELLQKTAFFSFK